MPTDVCAICGKRIELTDVGTFVTHPASPSPHAGNCGGSGGVPARVKEFKEASRGTNRAKVEDAHLTGTSSGMQNLLVDILNRLDGIETQLAINSSRAADAWMKAAIATDDLEDLKAKLKEALGIETGRSEDS